MGEAIVFGPDEGEALRARGSVMLFKAIAASTGGAFSLHQRDLPPGGRRPPVHRHTNCQEAFFVLEGDVEFVLGDGEASPVRRGPGTFVLVPGGVPHTFGNPGPGAARVLVLHAPAMDQYFRELQALWSGDTPPDRDTELDLMRRHGMEPG
ncbi:MAG TPA: cupin domain-containing protein, partial [Actinomycetota bacterium]